MDGKMDRRMNDRMNGRMNGRMDESIDECLWMKSGVGEWMVVGLVCWGSEKEGRKADGGEKDGSSGARRVC